jgi:hypothetical protein
MCGSPRQKANAYVFVVANRSAALLTFEKPVRSGFPVDFVRIDLNMGDDESLDVPLTADLAAECGGDAKPANLSRLFCERCHASLHTLLAVRPPSYVCQVSPFYVCHVSLPVSSAPKP